jgi:hypothetical protein
MKVMQAFTGKGCPLGAPLGLQGPIFTASGCIQIQFHIYSWLRSYSKTQGSHAPGYHDYSGNFLTITLAHS